MEKLKAPNAITCCLNCGNRHFKCHKDCEIYQKQKEKYEFLKEKERKDKIPLSVYLQTQEKVMKALKKRNKK